MSECRGCGNEVEGDAVPTNCPQCPPTKCEDCGGINDWESGALCSCWTDLRDMPMADVKALFAEHDDELSIDPVSEETNHAD